MLELINIQQTFENHSITYPNWQLDQRGKALILGSSGSGKTTLLHIICGLLQPSAGNVRLNGNDLRSMKGSDLDRFRGQHIGLVFQRPHLIRSLNIFENLKLAAHLSGKKITNQRINELLESLDLISLKSRKVHEISEGQAQRVAIARAVVHEPLLLAADEPTASLDDVNCQKVIQLLLKQAENCGAQLIIATHDQRVKDQFKNHLQL